MNASITVEPVIADLTAANAEELLEDADLILDGTDNFEARFLINDYAVREEIPWIYVAAVGSYGLKLPIVPGTTSCLRCVYPEPPQGAQPTCETDGVIAPITASIAALACGDALKILAAGPDSVKANLTTVGRLDWRDSPNEAIGPRSRVPVLRTSRFRVFERPAPGADQLVRPQRRADS